MTVLIRRTVSPVLAAIAAVLVVATVAAAGGSTTSNPNAHLKVMITPKSLCVEPFNKKDLHTSFDIKLKGCGPGAMQLMWPKNGTNGRDGVDGKNGIDGKNGVDGKNGTNGTNGTNGKDSTVPGPAGTNGKDGKDGAPGKDAPTLDGGAVHVNVTRGERTSTWAYYPTTLDALLGGTTGGTFRFTCTAAQAPCAIAAEAAVISDKTGTENLYPRLSVSVDGTQETAPQPRFYCEYADGSTGGGYALLTKQPRTSTPTYTPVPVNIGGTADCFASPQPGGDVVSIQVPEGYYNVTSTFVFTPTTS